MCTHALSLCLQLSGTIYVGGDNFEEYTKLLTSAYGKFAWTNPLHTNVFPGVRLMEVKFLDIEVLMLLWVFQAVKYLADFQNPVSSG